MQYFLIIIYLSIQLALFGQNQKCDTIYQSEQLDETPEYNQSTLLQYFNKEFIPIIIKDIKDSDNPPTSFYMTMVIDKEGRIIEIVNIKGDYSEETKQKLLIQLTKMDTWKPGKIGNQAVCCEWYYSISCILLR